MSNVKRLYDVANIKSTAIRNMRTSIDSVYEMHKEGLTFPGHKDSLLSSLDKLAGIVNGEQMK